MQPLDLSITMQVNSVLSYLEGDLGLSKEDLSKVVQKFPEVMNLNVERRLKANIEHMQKVTAESKSIQSLHVSSWKHTEYQSCREVVQNSHSWPVYKGTESNEKQNKMSHITILDDFATDSIWTKVNAALLLTWLWCNVAHTVFSSALPYQ